MNMHMYKLLMKARRMCDYVDKSSDGTSQAWDPLEWAYRALMIKLDEEGDDDSG